VKEPGAPDLDGAAAAVAVAAAVVQGAASHLAASGDADNDQVVAYDLAHAAAAVRTAEVALD
jgi:(2S)-methylsuccinyl-CoA dehydrogenase